VPITQSGARDRATSFDHRSLVCTGLAVGSAWRHPLEPAMQTMDIAVSILTGNPTGGVEAT